MFTRPFRRRAGLGQTEYPQELLTFWQLQDSYRANRFAPALVSEPSDEDVRDYFAPQTFSPPTENVTPVQPPAPAPSVSFTFSPPPPAQTPATVIVAVQNTDGTQSLIAVPSTNAEQTQRPELIDPQIDAEPGGTSGFNIAQQEASAKSKAGLFGLSALMLLVFLGEDESA